MGCFLIRFNYHMDLDKSNTYVRADLIPINIANYLDKAISLLYLVYMLACMHSLGYWKHREVYVSSLASLAFYTGN